jgi:hypothetical protein
MFLLGTATCLIFLVLMTVRPLVPAGMGVAATQTILGVWPLMARRSAPLT